MLLVGLLVAGEDIEMTPSARARGTAAALFVMLLVMAWVFSGPRTLVDWQAVRGVAFESDDWGLCGFVPAASAWDGLALDSLRTGRVPDVYWNSTLEDSGAVADLATLLAQYQGRDGLPALLQPNYIVSSRHFEITATGSENIAGDSWRQYDLPALPPFYQRPGLWLAVAEAVRQGVWWPELHGAFHYDPRHRELAVARNRAARVAATRGILPFPGSMRAWELGPWRSRADLERELSHSCDVFATLFGRRPGSVMAPDYTWDNRCEELWQEQGLAVIQGKRQQRHPRYRRGTWLHRLRKTVARAWSRLVHPRLTYLERNCEFEPLQAGDTRQVTSDCLEQIRRAWGQGEPAIVETHRINFVHTDPALSTRGRQALAGLLAELAGGKSDAAMFLTDQEMAQLYRTGTSWAVRGPRLVVRNLTHGRRLVAVPAIPDPAGTASWPAQNRLSLLAIAPDTVAQLAWPPHSPW